MNTNLDSATDVWAEYQLAIGNNPAVPDANDEATIKAITALLDAKDEESRRAGERAFEMHATLQGKLDLTEAEVLRLIRMGNEKICDALGGKCPSLLSSELFEELQDREVKGEPAAAYRCTNCNYLLDPSDVKVLTRYVSGGIPKGELWHCNVYFPCRPLYLRPDPLGLAAENLSLRAALAEARESIEGWAEYASEYFKDRWDLKGDLARVDAVLASPSPAAQAVLEGLRAVAEVCEEGLERRYIDDWWFKFKEDFPALAAGLEEAF